MRARNCQEQRVREGETLAGNGRGEGVAGAGGSRGPGWGGSVRRGYLERCSGSRARPWEDGAPLQLSRVPDESPSRHLAAVPPRREERDLPGNSSTALDVKTICL